MESMNILRNNINNICNIKSHHSQILQCTYHTPIFCRICKLLSIYKEQRGSRKRWGMNRLSRMHVKLTNDIMDIFILG